MRKASILKPAKNNLYSDIKSILEYARSNAVRAVNFSMVIAYWEVGKRIVVDEQEGKKKAGYGKYLLRDLAEKLTADFGAGFEERELRKMRQFFLLFSIRDSLSPESQKKVKSIKRGAVSPESSGSHNLTTREVARMELSWTHYRHLMRVENEEARKYYMNEAAENNWSTRILERQINTLYFERLVSSKNKKALIQKTNKEVKNDKPSILDFVKDPYILEFLKLKPNTTLFEKELETELLSKLQLFLLELGKGFSFVSRQQRISAEGEHFYIDLVFYNYILKCFVLIDLKTDKLSHQDIGQMDLYVRYYEDKIKQKTDNPTIGIILCTEKNETIVKYSMLKESKQLFASKYKLYLPSEKEWIAELNEEVKQLKSKK